VTLEDKAAEQNRNHALLTAIGSQQKALNEVALKDRSPPVVGFDLTAQTPTPRSDLMRAAPLPVDTRPINPSVPGVPAVGSSDTTSTVSTDQSHELKTIIRGLVADLSKELGDLRDSVQAAQEHALDRQTDSIGGLVRTEMEQARTERSPWVDPTAPNDTTRRTFTSQLRPTPNQEPDGSVDRYWAIARGRTTGVFHLGDQVYASVRNFAAPLYKEFADEDVAYQWLAAHTEDRQSQNVPDLDRQILSEPRLDRTVGAPAPAAEAGPQVYFDQMVDPATMGPDPSTGTSRQVYNTSIQVESEVLKLLCPKGVPQIVQQELSSTCVDVVSLPSKSNSSGNPDGGLIMDHFAEAVGSLQEMSS
jgi:hypothetical protein